MHVAMCICPAEYKANYFKLLSYQGAKRPEGKLTKG